MGRERERKTCRWTAERGRGREQHDLLTQWLQGKQPDIFLLSSEMPQQQLDKHNSHFKQRYNNRDNNLSSD